MSYYENKGYIIPREYTKYRGMLCKAGTKIFVKIEDIMNHSTVKVTCKCDRCEKIYPASYNYISRSKYFIEQKKTFCRSCANKVRHSGMNNHNYKHGCNEYKRYKGGAKTRGYEFSLTVDRFKEIISNKCHYCGGYNDDINMKNGIDRIDNTIGYINENCFPCCIICNKMKLALRYDEFLLHIEKIYKNVVYENY